MSLPGTQSTATNWAGIGYGILLGFVAGWFQFKVPPEWAHLPVAASLGAPGWTPGDTHAFVVGPTGRYLEILARPLSAVAISRQNDDWLAAAYTFGAITAFSATIAFYLGMPVRRIG